MSAKNKTKLPALKQHILDVYSEQYRAISDNALSKFLKTAVKRQKPLIGRGTKKPYIYNVKQFGSKPPQFTVHIDAKSNLRFTYLNFLERLLREKFGFDGAPIKMWVEKKHFVIVRMELYTLSGKLLKTMQLDKIKAVNKKYVATHLRMENKLRKNTYTELDITKINIDVELPKNTFSKKALFE